jgi:hypothetical protein
MGIEPRPVEDEAGIAFLVRPRENTAWMSELRLEQQPWQAR